MKAAWSELAVLRTRILTPSSGEGEGEEKAELELDFGLENDMLVFSAWDIVMMDAAEAVGIDAAAEELWDDVNVNAKVDDAGAAADAVAGTGATDDASSRLTLGIWFSASEVVLSTSSPPLLLAFVLVFNLVRMRNDIVRCTIRGIRACTVAFG